MQSWADRLAAAEADLRAQEQLVLDSEPTPEELRALEDARDKLAADHDAFADARDSDAFLRDASGLRRDVRASMRDRSARTYAQDRDRGATDRFMAGSDRDLAAGDRSDASDDRSRDAADRTRAADDRHRAAEGRAAAAAHADQLDEEIAGLQQALLSRLVIGQAEGLLMERYDLDAESAFRLLIRLSNEGHEKLRAVAARLVADHRDERTRRSSGR